MSSFRSDATRWMIYTLIDELAELDKVLAVPYNIIQGFAKI